MNKKALFFDYDGTIISDKTGNIPKSTILALKELKEKGYRLFLNTGRTKAILDKALIELDFDGMLLGCGSYIEYKGEVLYSVEVHKDRYQAIINKVNDVHVDAFFEGTNSLYLSHGITSQRLLRLLDKYKEADFSIQSIDDLDHDFVKMFICFKDMEKQPAFYDFITADFEYIDRGQQSAELILKDHSKATAIAYIIKKLGIKEDDCYAFGDSNNDVPMFRYVKHSALIGNDNEELCQEVAYVSKDVDQDGLVEALRAFDLL